MKERLILEKHFEKYDGMLFGNGLLINLVAQLQPLIKSEKYYLLNIDDFLKAFIDNRISPKEEKRIFSLFYKTQDVQNLANFEKIKRAFSQYYRTHNANIEYWLGVDLFKSDTCGYDYSAIKTIFPGMYNIWHEIMIDYLYYLNLNKKIEKYENSIMSILDKDAYIFTTNFDRIFEGLKPEHLHGSFIKGYRKYQELIFAYISEESFYFKCIWGWNGIGKLNFIQSIKEITGYENYFDFDFFFDKKFYIKNLLIYGMSFQNSGYMKELSVCMPRYEKPSIGGIVDEHILSRLNGLQTQRQLEKITFAYYSDSELKHYEELAGYFDLHEVDYLRSSSLQFVI
jgi:hypothetical protein